MPILPSCVPRRPQAAAPGNGGAAPPCSRGAAAGQHAAAGAAGHDVGAQQRRVRQHRADHPRSRPRQRQLRLHTGQRRLPVGPAARRAARRGSPPQDALGAVTAGAAQRLRRGRGAAAGVSSGGGVSPQLGVSRRAGRRTGQRERRRLAGGQRDAAGPGVPSAACAAAGAPVQRILLVFRGLPWSSSNTRSSRPVATAPVDQPAAGTQRARRRPRRSVHRRRGTTRGRRRPVLCRVGSVSRRLAGRPPPAASGPRTTQHDRVRSCAAEGWRLEDVFAWCGGHVSQSGWAQPTAARVVSNWLRCACTSYHAAGHRRQRASA